MEVVQTHVCASVIHSLLCLWSPVHRHTLVLAMNRKSLELARERDLRDEKGDKSARGREMMRVSCQMNVACYLCSLTFDTLSTQTERRGMSGHVLWPSWPVTYS